MAIIAENVLWRSAARSRNAHSMQRFSIYRTCARNAERALRLFDDTLMPLCCVFCGARSSAENQRTCRGCFADLPWIKSACPRCAAPLETTLPVGVDCARCQKRPPPFVVTVAPLRYEFPVDAGLKALKFGRRLHYAPAFAALLATQSGCLPSTIDALLPVPLHWRRQMRRGFNQARELCQPLARDFGLPIVDVAKRRRFTRYQSGLSAAERRRNLRHAFDVAIEPRYRHIVIVDDVVTTGETTRQLANALVASGVPQVSVLAVARAVGFSRRRPD
jgi:ComF family protein